MVLLFAIFSFIFSCHQRLNNRTSTSHPHNHHHRHHILLHDTIKHHHHPSTRPLPSPRRSQNPTTRERERDLFPGGRCKYQGINMITTKLHAKTQSPSTVNLTIVSYYLLSQAPHKLLQAMGSNKKMHGFMKFHSRTPFLEGREDNRWSSTRSKDKRIRHEQPF